MIYLYGITGPLTEVPEATGLQDAPLRLLAAGALSAVYSVHEPMDVRPDAESAWAHEHAVESVMAEQAILPARFGTTFDDVDKLAAALESGAAVMARRLAQLEGCVELAVRINPLSPTGGQRPDGRRYLLDPLSDRRHREALAESTLACLREFAVDSRLTSTVSGDQTVSISYLVKTTGVERFSRAVGRLQKRWPEFALSCTGPWAPYSFACQEGVA